MEEYVSFEIAKKLEELGFDYTCLRYYSVDNKKLKKNEYWAYEDRIFAPMISQALKWLREEKDIHIEIYANATGYDYIVSDTPNLGGSDRYWNDFRGPNDGGCWDTYEECALAGIEYVLNSFAS